MVKLKRLKILKYRNVRPGTELHFDDGVNLVLGQNASGKTTLLALISAVLREDFSHLKDEEYEIEAEAEFQGPSKVLKVLKVSHRRKSGGAESSSASSTRNWDFQKQISRPREIHAPTAPLAPAWAGPGLADVFVSVDCFDAYRFDESLGVFSALTGRDSEATHLCVPQTASSERRADDDADAWEHVVFVPPDIQEKLRRSVAGDPIFNRPLASADLQLCRDIAEVCGFRDVSIEPNFSERRIVEDAVVEFIVEGFTLEITRQDGTIVHHDRLSYGQKRLLAFFYYLACNPSIVIADELVNGLHHRWIETCMKALGDRQAFLTSQNPLLFDYVEFESVEQVRSRFITCRLEQVDGREQMVWENMSQRDAETFFTAYQAEIEHVGDILITRGLW